MKINHFTQINAWQKAHELFILIDNVTKQFPKYETYVLSQQIRSSSLSIPSNIAEGFGRTTFKDKLKFYTYAHASMMEVESQLIAVKDLKYFKDAKTEELIFELLSETKGLLIGLRNATVKKCR